MESHGQPSMQNLLHSPSPPGDGQDILQEQQSSSNETYMLFHNSGDMTFNTWSPFNPTSRASDLQERVEALGELRLIPNTTMDDSTPISRYMTDENSTRTLLDINSLTGFSNQPSNTHNTHLTIATGWNYAPSYHDDAVSSAVSSVYDYAYSAGGSSSSPDDQHFQDINYDAPASPSYHRGHTRGANNSHRSSLGGCLLSDSLGLNGGQLWRKAYTVDSNTEITNSVAAPLAVASDRHHAQDPSFVNPKSIQLTHADEERDEDGTTQEDFTGYGPRGNSIPGIYVNGHEHSDHEHDHEQSTPWEPNQGQYYTLSPMEVECSPPSSKSSPQCSPRLATKLDMKRGHRRSRSSSGSSKLSAKAHAEMMKPYKDITTSPSGKSHKGRGAGKKVKERQHCPDHPTKMFRHNSDFRKHMQTKHTRPFLCTFYFAGCDQTFGSKNEWKRHVFSQHLQLHYWRCDYPDCAERKAFFNRKDLFGQHLKRMHGPKSNTAKSSPEIKTWLARDIPEIQERCRKERRAPPESSKCGYCMKEFSGPNSWDMRMEHVGKHYEKNNYKDIDPKEWVMDVGLIDWATHTKIIEKMDNGVYKLLCRGKDSIEGEERRRSQPEQVVIMSDEDDEEDAEGEDENDY